RAQDLILRQRVEDYRRGDLDGRYPELRLEEDYLHVYGVMPRDVMHLLHPRPSRAGAAIYRPVGVTADVLAMVVESGPTHPRELRARFGASRTVNDWGGNSAVTTRALEELHYQGLLRVVRRENGTKIYESAPARSQNVPPRERLRRLTMLIARMLAPAPESS